MSGAKIDAADRPVAPGEAPGVAGPAEPSGAADPVPPSVRPPTVPDGGPADAPAPSGPEIGQGGTEVAFEKRVFRSALLYPLPLLLGALWLLLAADLSSNARWSLVAMFVLAWLIGAHLQRDRVVRPVQTLSNLLAALREGDFSIRARGARADDALGLALVEVNTLSAVLHDQRMGALEATGLLRNVMAEIDVAVLAFDPDRRLRLINRAGERLLGHPAARIVGSRAAEFGLDHCLEGETPRTIQASFPGGTGPWELRRTSFIQGGRPHQLLVLSDLSRALREEERQAWQRLVRVLTHEINNSLTPIQSIAGSLRDLVGHETRTAEDREDLRRGLAVIQSRSASLSRFLSAYARLTRLPPPQRRAVDVETWVRRAIALEARAGVAIVRGPPVTLNADPDQLDQLLINLIRNAVDAALETGGGVEVSWSRRGESLELWVLDEGPGVPDTANLFVPFYTTKPGGSGIGLALSRQIAEGHGGSLALENRADGNGCRAVLVLPIHPASPAVTRQRAAERR